jgi:DNA-binding cell septation regulator SpoVG
MLHAYANIVLYDSLLVHNLRIIHEARGYSVVMSSKQRRDGRRADIAHPITLEARRMIEEAVMAEYRRVVSEVG